MTSQSAGLRGYHGELVGWEFDPSNPTQRVTSSVLSSPSRSPDTLASRRAPRRLDALDA